MKRLRRFHARGPVVAPLAALVATTVVAIATAATSGLALCRHQLALSMPMPMPMPDAPGAAPTILDVCPIVMGLVVLALSLGAWALAAVALERHRAVLRHRLLAVLAGLPFVRTIVGLAAVSALPIALIILVDAGGPSSTESWLLLAALVAGGSALATGAIVLGARFAVALGRRLMLRIGATHVSARARVLPESGHRREPVSFASAYGDVCVLAAGLGLRAPPPILR